MQQRFAVAVLIRLNSSPTSTGQTLAAIHGTVQAADAPVASHFTSLRQLAKWIEDVLPPHDSPTESIL